MQDDNSDDIDDDETQDPDGATYQANQRARSGTTTRGHRNAPVNRTDESSLESILEKVSASTSGEDSLSILKDMLLLGQDDGAEGELDLVSSS
jgi:hypothetical protein